jgi:hypothetical protein
MKTILLFISLCLISTLQAAPTIDASNPTNVMIDGVGRGYIQDVVKNYASLASSIRSNARTAIEAKIDACTEDFQRADLKAMVDLVKSAGVTINAGKENSVTSAVTSEAAKKEEVENKRKGL